jgi:hypothetical protein
VAWAQGAYAPLYGPEQVAWFDRLQAEHDNLRAAMGWSKLALVRAETPASPAADAALEWGRTLWRFWQARGHLSEAREWLTELLALVPGRTAARANALWVVGYLALGQGDFLAARPLVEEGLAVAREARQPFGITMSLVLLGALAILKGDLGRAAALLEESLVHDHYECAG